MYNILKIVKKKPSELWCCNMMMGNGCEKYCTEYKKGLHWVDCKHRKKLCEIIGLSVYWLLHKSGEN